MEQAKNGDTVTVHYTGKLDSGQVFDTSKDREPVEFTIGQGQVIEGFEEAVVGMSPGEEKTTKVSADKAFGPRVADKVVSLSRDQFPDNVEPEVGQRLRASQPGGKEVSVTVVDVSESTVTLDANHPLAGKDIVFEIQLEAIQGIA